MKKELTEPEKSIKKIIDWKDVCPKSYDGQHIWAEGQLYKELNVFGYFIPFIKKLTLTMDICRACGTIKRKEQYV